MARMLSFSIFFCVNFHIIGQIGWEQGPLHGAYKYPNGLYDDETMHLTPGEISFWTDDTYDVGASLDANRVSLHAPNKRAVMGIDGFSIQASPAGPALELAYIGADGMSLYNGASWDVFTLTHSTGPGVMNITNGSGVNNIYLGHGFFDNGDGRILISDNAGTVQAGMYIDGTNKGVLFADVKNFRVPHPEKSGKEIWYASLEGPEAAAYERGTAQLEGGQAFVSYSEHYQIITNPETVTIQLTPFEWDTYGLAIVRKSKNGFYVRELKGGQGNFKFDWEVKGMRTGKEDFLVIRDQLESPVQNDIAIDRNRKNRLKKTKQYHSSLHGGCSLPHKEKSH